MIYIDGCEFAHCVEGDPIWAETREKMEQLPLQAKEGTTKPNYVQAVFFKNTVAPELFDMLATQNPDWRFLRTDTNPFLSGRSAA